MCGIVGLFLKDRGLEPRLGELLSGMLVCMGDRGPDSAGFAIYGGAEAEVSKLTYRVHGQLAPQALDSELEAALGRPVSATGRGTHILIAVPRAIEAEVRRHMATNHPGLTLVGIGNRMELYKEVGTPREVATRFDLAAMTGSHGIGHTRMATESAVTTAGAHPFSTGRDQCLVHNGSLSNHNSVRRRLAHEGVTFATDNDSEVAAGYLTWRMKEGASLREALDASLADLDGFFTFLVATETGFAVLRDPIACKPAVMAESDAYVAFASEYRALAGLPGIETAHVFEPEPARTYVWERAA
ncbi:MAG: glutamine amidotransferase family protein [Bauldia sp.]|nr:glutamine amidotransferase family protein [Bauldia sp.]